MSLAAVCLLTISQTGFTQTTDFSTRNPSPYGGMPSSIVRSPYQPSAGTRIAQAPEAVTSPTVGAETAPAIPKPPPKPRNIIPYTIRPGDSMGSIAAMFGLTPEDLARINHMHPDDELMAGDELKVPNPFSAQLKSLESQVSSLAKQAQDAQVRADRDESETGTLRERVQDLTADNQSLNSSLRTLPWWHATALTTSVIAALMFGVMVVTLFEWWRMRRRYVELASLADDLGRLDYKYKAMLAKAELRLQRLYGRRRGAIPEGQPRPKLPEEVEIERLNEELKEVLEHHLSRLGAGPRSQRRARWRDLFGNVESPVEARSARR